MKYQTEYQRNFQRRAAQKGDDPPIVDRKRTSAPLKRSSSLSPTRSRIQSAGIASRPNQSSVAVIGPNEKFSNSHLYRLRQPVEDRPRPTQTKEFAILGRNEKFNDNVIYPMRKPVVEDAPAAPRRREKSESHSCGIQTELHGAPRVSFDPRQGRESIPARNRLGPQSEYQQQFHWKKQVSDPTSDQMLVEEAKVRDRRSDPALPLSVIDPSEKLLADRRGPPPILEIDSGRRTPLEAATSFRPEPQVQTTAPKKNERLTEYQSRYKSIAEQKKPATRKSYEAEWAIERKRREIVEAERAHTDDEGTAGELAPSEKLSRQKHFRNNLRRWKSEYQTNYKPFWRFDYKNGKWYKDSEAEQHGFNPNLFWYKELRSTREKANEYRVNALADHFNRDHMLQLQTGQGAGRSFLAWDTNDDELDDVTTVRSVEKRTEIVQRQREAERLNKERVQSAIHYPLENENVRATVTKSENFQESEKPPVRTIYLDDARTRNPSAATRALIRNLNSSSVQEQLNWDSESLKSERTITERENNLNRRISNDDFQLDSERNFRDAQNKSPSFQTTLGFSLENDERKAQLNGAESKVAAGRASIDTHALDKRASLRPHSSTINRPIYEQPISNRSEQYSPASRSSFQNHLNSLDRSFAPRNQDDDVLSVASSRSLSSSCSLALQTHELARQNMQKFWGKK